MLGYKFYYLYDKCFDFQYTMCGQKVFNFILPPLKLMPHGKIL